MTGKLTLAMLKKAQRILEAADIPAPVLKIIAEYPMKREMMPAFEVRKRKKKLARRVLKNRAKRANHERSKTK